MKNYLIYFVVIVCLSGAFISCSKETVHIALSGNNADFVVTNKTTGKTVKNKGLQINLGSVGESLAVSAGDELELVYTPKSEYQKYSWSIDFTMFNSQTITIKNKPYTHTFIVDDVVVGSYEIECRAVIDDKDVESSGYEAGTVKINVVE